MSTIESSSDGKHSEWQETWGSREFVERWATKGDWQAPIREPQIAMVLRMIPHPIDTAMRVLDIGAGYGALAAAVLRERSAATAVCLDASEAMLKLGRERNGELMHRMSFIQGSLESSHWLNSVNADFDAVIWRERCITSPNTNDGATSSKKFSPCCAPAAVSSTPITSGRRRRA